MSSTGLIRRADSAIRRVVGGDASLESHMQETGDGAGATPLPTCQRHLLPSGSASMDSGCREFFRPIRLDGNEVEWMRCRGTRCLCEGTLVVEATAVSSSSSQGRHAPQIAPERHAGQRPLGTHCKQPCCASVGVLPMALRGRIVPRDSNVTTCKQSARKDCSHYLDGQESRTSILEMRANWAYIRWGAVRGMSFLCGRKNKAY